MLAWQHTHGCLSASENLDFALNGGAMPPRASHGGEFMNMIDQDRLNTLKSLAPLEAIRAWLGETVGPGDRTALAIAIQRDRRIELDDDEIAYLVEDGIECGLDARAVLERLLTAGDGVQPRGDAGLPAR